MNCYFYPVAVAWTICFIVLFPTLLPLWKLATGYDKSRIAHDFIWAYGRILLLLVYPFAPLKRGGTNLRKWRGRPVILISNHLSFFDPYLMAALPISDLVFTSRSWPFKMPWYAPFMRIAGYINMEELGWDECLNVSRGFLSRNAAIVFFPEGHRSKDGALQRFYSGAFKIAKETGATIIPICITGSRQMLRPGGPYFRPARMSITALDPVHPQDFAGPLAHVEIRKQVKGQIEQHLLTKGKCRKTA
jgi:1-acyl-sn-glycerol-3-phosphate acyltransferase